MTFDTRINKVLRDLVQERTRALLVLLALVVGGWGVASVVASTTIIQREIQDNFLVTNPAHATLSFTGSGDVEAGAESAAWVTDAERRTQLAARARGGFDGRVPVVLFVVDDFERQSISTFELERGRWPSRGEVVLERDAFRVLGLTEDPDAVDLQLPGLPWIRTSVAGVVHDAGQAPARMEHVVYAYVTAETARQLGADLSEQEVIVRMAPPAVTSRPLAQAHAGLLADTLAGRGFAVTRIRVPEPETHPHEGQMQSLLFLQFAFGGMALLLSGVVVVNMISSLMQRHVAQIGVLKTLGGTSTQVGGIYALMVGLLSVASLVVVIPLGFWTGDVYANYVVGQLNFDRLTPGVPLSAWFWVIGATLLLPQLAAAIPVMRGVRISVRDALTKGDGVGSDAGAGLLARAGIPLALRNVARRPARLVLTTLALAVGLGALASAYHVGASIRRTMEVARDSRPFDVSIVFDAPVEPAQVQATLEPAFDHLIASWTGLSGGAVALVRDDGTVSDPFTALAPDPLDGPLAPVVEGEWRVPPEGRALIVSTGFASGEQVSVGDIVTLRIGGSDSRWPIGAVVREIGGSNPYLLTTEPLGFRGIVALRGTVRPQSAEARARTEAALEQGAVTGPHGSTAVSLQGFDAVYQAAVVRHVDDALEAAGVRVRRTSTKAEIVAGLEDHVYVMTRLLAMAALVVLAVGGLGLASAMNVSVLERTREVGVLRTLGATPFTLGRIFAAEAAVVVGLAWAIGTAASYPLGRIVSDFFGNLMFRTPLDVGTSLVGAAWGAAVCGILVVGVTLMVWGWVGRVGVAEGLRWE